MSVTENGVTHNFDFSKPEDREAHQAYLAERRAKESQSVGESSVAHAFEEPSVDDLLEEK